METNHLLTELFRLRNSGFTNDFQFLSNGLIQCLTIPGKIYRLEEVCISLVPCPIIKATLYKIITNDGLLGSSISFWEDG
jgi:hypothetical protein